MYRLTNVFAILLALTMLAPATIDVDASDKPLYTAQVKKARAYLKTKMNRRQFVCLHKLWWNESRWKVRAKNKYSGAYGIPQALPGRKMRKYGKHWRTRAMIQVKWGYHYVKVRYGTPCNALRFQYYRGWY